MGEFIEHPKDLHLYAMRDVENYSAPVASPWGTNLTGDLGSVANSAAIRVRVSQAGLRFNEEWLAKDIATSHVLVSHEYWEVSTNSHHQEATTYFRL